ncbi:Hypp8272 [Branchiostoma lanceolatum]|uniref:Hypp8272 protein n=1 Tax=Branchiostoma lanceolatum TaxID=7740 RepID=A0A8J9Z7L4_BRALA|nr:Hypp8272 [Branchiostoma lanceolatum]
MSFMGKRLDNFQSEVNSKFGDNGPVMFGYDNINIFRAVRHLRVMKGKPRMWNFTVRMALKPNLEGIQELFCAKETAEMPQKPVEDLTADDVFLGAHPELATIWEEAQDSFYLDLLDTGLNTLPKDTKQYANKSSAEQKAWLSAQQLESSNTYTITQKPTKPVNCRPSDITILPLSTENEATLTGTAIINEEFAREFNIPVERSNTKYLPFDENNLQFDISAARKRFEFKESLKQHRIDQAALLNTIESDPWEEAEEDMTLDVANMQEDDTEGPVHARHLGSFRRKWKEADENMKTVVSTMEQKLRTAERAGNAADIMEFEKYRKKVKQETYGKDKFKENNLQLIREANRDVGYGYGLCAVVEFRDSDSFPSDEELLNCGTDKGPLLLSRFKEWLKKCSEDDVDFSYRAQSVTLFGPLTRLLYSSIKNGDGAARETVWMLLLPIFSQSKKKNYWIEALAHTVNVTAAWPIAIRMMVRQNCSVSVDGRKGHNIACDEFVETHMVKPLKQYCSGQTTLKTLQRLNVNLQLIGSARASYKSRSGFDIHNTKRHSEPSPLRDQVLVCLFCLQEQFFKYDKERRKPKVYPLSQSGSQKFVPNDRCDVYMKGCDKVRSNFDRKMYDIFPQRRRVPSVFRANVPTD